VADDREVVRDEEEAEVELARQADEEVRDLGLRGRVQRGQRLVEDDDRGIRREGPRDREPLTLPTRELVREAVGGGR
jgi:hypothetical protein